MSQYAISAALKSSLQLEDDSIFRKLDELLFRRNCLAVTVREVRGCYPGTLLSVMQVIASATLRWKKPFELLRVRDFIQGRPDSGCYTVGMSDRTVYRALKALCRENLLVRVTSNDGRDVHYALNFEVVLERVGNAIDSIRGKSLIWQETARLYAELKASRDVQNLAHMVRRFAGQTIRDTKEFIHSLLSLGGKAVATLETAVRTAKQVSKEYTERKACSKAEKPILRGSGVDPIPALELWHKEVKDTDEHYWLCPCPNRKSHRPDEELAA